MQGPQDFNPRHRTLWHPHLDFMARKYDVWPRFRYDVSFADVLFAIALVEIVKRPVVTAVGIPVPPVRVIVRAIVRVPVIPITIAKTPSPRINDRFLSGSCRREKSRAADRPKRQAQTKRDCEPLLAHDPDLLTKRNLLSLKK